VCECAGNFYPIKTTCHIVIVNFFVVKSHFVT
jgi:hypothetical protein